MATQFKEDNWILLFEQCPEDFTTARYNGKEAFKEQRQNMHQAFPIFKELLVVHYISVKNVP
jgi:hypothetical protein